MRGNDDYERRMQNWRRWKLSPGRGSTGASPDVYEALASGIYNRTDPRVRESNIPLIQGEAEDTDQAVRSLSRSLRAAVETMYLQGGGVHRKARLCGCRKESFLQRLEVARGLIMGRLEDMRTRRLEEQRKGEARGGAARRATAGAA